MSFFNKDRKYLGIIQGQGRIVEDNGLSDYIKKNSDNYKVHFKTSSYEGCGWRPLKSLKALVEMKLPIDSVTTPFGTCFSYKNYPDLKVVVGERSLFDRHELGYSLGGRVSVWGKKLGAFTTSRLIDIDGVLYDVATLYTVTKGDEE